MITLERGTWIYHMNIIIYGSCYGTSKQYAKELARRTNFELLSYEEVDEINAYETIIYIGGLYAGGVLGMKKVFSRLSDCSNKNIIIATVGLSDPSDQENINNIRNFMEKQLSKEIFKQAHIIHLRGGIDYAKLGLKHKAMMSLIYKKATGLPDEKKTAEVRAMIETYNKEVNFVDFDRLDEIIRIIQE